MLPLSNPFSPHFPDDCPRELIPQPGHPLYERFLMAWVETDMNVRLCFHGTPEANVPAILRDGVSSADQKKKNL